MPPPADMGSMHAQYMAGQAASAVEYAGQASSVQHTMQNMYAATAMGAQTAMQGVQMAAGSVYNGASSALGQVYSVAQGAGAVFQPPVGVPPPEGGVGIPDIVHGMAVGTMGVAGGLAGFAAYEPAAAVTRGIMGGGVMSTSGRAWGAGLARGGIGGLLRGGVGALGVGAAGLAVPVAAAMAVEKVFSIGTEQMTQIRDINNTMTQNMGRFGFYDPNILSPGGANFRREAAAITNYVGNIQEIGRGQAGRFVEGAMQMGLFEGAAGEGGEGIVGRARKLADAIRDSSRLLNTSMEESLQTMGELRQAGFRDPIGAATGVMMGNRGMARATGGTFSAAEMHGYGMQRAMQFRGAGVAGEFGYAAATQNLTTATIMMQQNAMPDWLAMNLGGRQGVAQTFQQSLGAFMQSGLGQMNVLAQQQGMGGGNFNQMAQAAAGQLQDPFQAAQAFGNLPQMMTEMGAQQMQGMQAQNLLMIGQRALGQKFGQAGAEEQISALTGLLSKSPQLAQNFGVQDINQARALATFAIQGGDALGQQAQARRIEMQESITEDYMSRNYGVRGAIYQARGAMQRWGQRNVAQPVGDVYAGVAGAAQEAGRNISNWWYGTRRETVGGDMEGLAAGVAARFLGEGEDTTLNAMGGRYTGATVAGSEQFERMREAGLTQRIGFKEYIANRERFIVEGGSAAAELAGSDEYALTEQNLAIKKTFSLRGIGTALTDFTGRRAAFENRTIEVADVRATQAANQSAARVRLAAEEGIDQNAVFEAALAESLETGGAGIDVWKAGGLLTRRMMGATGEGGLVGQMAKLPSGSPERRRLQEQFDKIKTFRDTFASGLQGRGIQGRSLQAVTAAYAEGAEGAPSAMDLIGAAVSSQTFETAMAVKGATPERALVATLQTQLGAEGFRSDERMQKALRSVDYAAQERNDPEAQAQAMSTISSFLFGKEETRYHTEYVDVGGSWGAYGGANMRTTTYKAKGEVDFSALGTEQQKYLTENLGRLAEIGRLQAAGKTKDAFRLAEGFRTGLGEGVTVGVSQIMTMAGDQHSKVSMAARTAQSSWEDAATRRWLRGMKLAGAEVDFSQVKDTEMKEGLTDLMTGVTSAAGMGTKALRQYLDTEKAESIIQEYGNIAVERLSKQGATGRSLALLIKGKIGDKGEQKLTDVEIEKSFLAGEDVTGARTVARDPGRQAEIDSVTREMYMNMKVERQAMSEIANVARQLTVQLEAMKGGERTTVQPVSSRPARSGVQ